jgi:hypothetical protein
MMARRRLVRLGLLLAFVTAPAHAELCGDADGSGTVTVTDGVRVLRSAAGLGDACALTACDLDGSGAVSVTDGVLALRKAAGLAGNDRCPGGDTVAASAEAAIRESVPFLVGGVGLLVQQLTVAGAAGEACDNDPLGTLVFGEASIDFQSCALGDFVFTGHIDIEAQGGTYVDLSITDPATGRVTTANGRVSFRTSGDDRIVNGTPRLDSAFGPYTLSFDDLVVAPSGEYVAGQVVLDVRDTTLEGVATIAITFDGDDLARGQVVVTLEGSGATRPFVFDFATGRLSSP